MKHSLLTPDKTNFGELSEFKHRNVELYRSADAKNTAIYWTKLTDRSDRAEAKAYFELLRFGYKGGDHMIYIKFPGTEHFIEMKEGGYGSGRGNMTSSSGQNVWETGDDRHFEIVSQEPNLLLFIGKILPEFNFMNLVARVTKSGEEFLFRDSSNPPTFNEHEIDKALSEKYIKMSESVRTIEYAMKTKGAEPTYFVVDYPAYNFQYEKYSFKMIKDNEVEEMKVKNLARYRDGGTTIITVVDKDGKEHEFFSPTPFEKEKKTTWDKTTELKEVSQEDKIYLTHLLKIELEPLEEK